MISHRLDTAIVEHNLGCVGGGELINFQKQVVSHTIINSWCA